MTLTFFLDEVDIEVNVTDLEELSKSVKVPKVDGLVLHMEEAGCQPPHIATDLELEILTNLRHYTILSMLDYHLSRILHVQHCHCMC